VKRIHRIGIKGIAIFLAAGIAGWAALVFWPFRVPETEVTILRGASTGRIAALLKARGVVRSETAFQAAVLALGASRRLQSGRYAFGGMLNQYRIVRDLRDGRVVFHTVTIPEGCGSEKVADLLSRHLGVDSSAFLVLVRDPAVASRLGISAPSLEGYLYPDTYRLQSGLAPEEAIAALVAGFRAVFNDTLSARALFLGLTEHQAVTLASIVEGEAVLDSERAVIAAVYHNRLRMGMPLQACPTIQYLLPGGPRRLTTRDLSIPSPYNTYLHPGLPPGPVNNPGRASILAVLYPAPVQYLYLVANGDGSHTFSVRLNEHNAAKRRLNRLRQDLGRVNHRSPSFNNR
jgi:UPF0755 protein